MFNKSIIFVTGTELGDQLTPYELVCDSNKGQCACLPSREGRRCDMCSEGLYYYEHS